MHPRAVGQRIHQPRHLPVDARPVVHAWAASGRPNRRWPACAESGWWSRRKPRAPPWRCAPTRRSGCRSWRMPRASSASTARAERRAMSSQMGWPEGASAACGSVMPSASPTTCEVAAVPRNWQPPPGVAQARHRISRGCFQRDLPVGVARADGLHRARVFALFRQQRDAAGHQHAGQSARPGQRHHHGGQAFVAGGHARSRRARVGSERIRRPKTVAASLR